MEPLETRRSKPAETNAKTPLRETASQTAGPYVHIGCLPNMVGIDGIYPQDMTTNASAEKGNKITISGQIFEGGDIVCKDVLLEFWQANADGDYANGLWHRVGTNLETGVFTINTIMPGTTLDFDGNKLIPFISIWVAARGVNIALLTRVYFPDHEADHASDPQLALVKENRRKTLIARSTNTASEYHFDIHLQGDKETVFFDI